MNAVEEGTLEIVTQKLEELVKKKPVSPSPNINPRLVVLDIHNASSSSSRTALENEREIEQLEDQFRGKKTSSSNPNQLNQELVS